MDFGREEGGSSFTIPARACQSHPPPSEIAPNRPRAAELCSYAGIWRSSGARRRGHFFLPRAGLPDHKRPPNTGLCSRGRSRALGPPVQTRPWFPGSMVMRSKVCCLARFYVPSYTLFLCGSWLQRLIVVTDFQIPILENFTSTDRREYRCGYCGALF
jgi:hypothetical protein